jgi:hypothetical protein
MEQTSITPTQVAGMIMATAAIIGIVMAVLMWYQSKNMAGNPGPWSFKPSEYPFVIRSDQLAVVATGSFTLSNYLYVSGVTEQRSNPQVLWRWGITDPLRKSLASITASYIPAEEKIRYEFANISTGDEHRITSLDVHNISPLKWYHTALTIEGRSLDVYVNGTHVKSTQLPNVLKQNTDGIQMVGNSGILGQMAIWNITEGRMSEAEVRTQYKGTSDTMGAPILPVDFSFTTPDLSKLSLCPGMPWCEEVKGDCKTYVKYEYA